MSGGFKNFVGVVLNAVGAGAEKAAEYKSGKEAEIYYTALANLAKGTSGWITAETDKKVTQNDNKNSEDKTSQADAKPTTENNQGSANTVNVQTTPSVGKVNAQNTVLNNTTNASNNNYVANLLNNYFGAYNQNSNSGTKLSAAVIINNYFNNESTNNTVVIIIDNVANCQNIQQYLDAITNINTNAQAKPVTQEMQTPINGDQKAKEEEVTKENTNVIKDSKIASEDAKSFFINNLALTPSAIIIISFENKTAEVLSSNSKEKSELLSEVANIDNVEKIQDKDNTYEIVKGDTLWQIARDNNISLDELREANPWTQDRFSPDGQYALIYPGEHLTIPNTLEAAVKNDLNVSNKELQDLTKNSANEVKDLANKQENEKQADENLNRSVHQ